jgi:hypothetical protein
MIRARQPLRVSLSAISAFLGMFTDWDFPYRRDWQIGYVLTFDVARAAREDFDLSDRSPDGR